jgi:hypothetical protein
LTTSGECACERVGVHEERRQLVPKKQNKREEKYVINASNDESHCQDNDARPRLSHKSGAPHTNANINMNNSDEIEMKQTSPTVSTYHIAVVINGAYLARLSSA